MGKDKGQAITIAVDAMSGDRGCEVVVPAVARFLAKDKRAAVLLVGNQDELNARLAALSLKEEYLKRIKVIHASQQIQMDDPPTRVIRSKRDSSMHVALKLVADRKAQVCVSAGNTGALVMLSYLYLKTIPGVMKPAIISSFPTTNTKRTTRILDLGATPQATAEELAQLALIGAVAVREMDHVERPRVALLNIGSEEIKGNDEIRAAAKLLAPMRDLEYAGFIEADAMFEGDVDLVVCNGFVGNIALKTLEGSMRLVMHFIKRIVHQGLIGRLCALFALPLLSRFRKMINPDRYNGASLLGLDGIVIKSHGGASEVAFFAALLHAAYEARRNVPEKIKAKVAQALQLVHADRE